MKEEIDMDKLLELLNQFEKARIEKVNAEWLPYNIKLSFTPYIKEHLTNKANKDCQLEVCSKHYGFIQWLAKHFMLNVTKIDARIALLDFNVTDRMLMALAISEDPIALLVDCLKTEWTEKIE